MADSFGLNVFVKVEIVVDYCCFDCCLYAVVVLLMAVESQNARVTNIICTVEEQATVLIFKH